MLYPYTIYAIYLCYIPQGSSLWPSMFNIFTSGNNSGIDSGIECTVSKFADDSKLSGAVDKIEGRDAT